MSAFPFDIDTLGTGEGEAPDEFALTVACCLFADNIFFAMSFNPARKLKLEIGGSVREFVSKKKTLINHTLPLRDITNFRHLN